MSRIAAGSAVERRSSGSDPSAAKNRPLCKDSTGDGSLIWKGSGGQNFKLQHALGGGDLGHHLLQRLVHLAGLGGDGDTGAAVGGNGLVDGQYICP